MPERLVGADRDDPARVEGAPRDERLNDLGSTFRRDLYDDDVARSGSAGPKNP